MESENENMMSQQDGDQPEAVEQKQNPFAEQSVEGRDTANHPPELASEQPEGMSVSAAVLDTINKQPMRVSQTAQGGLRSQTVMGVNNEYGLDGAAHNQGTTRSVQPPRSVRSVDTGVAPNGQVFCQRHPNKAIEFFDRVRNDLVCARCMFENREAQDLVELDEVTGIVRQNIRDLRTLMDTTRRTNEDNISFVEHRRSEVVRMKEQQLNFIEVGFSEVIKKLEEKRDILKTEFTGKYDAELARFDQKREVLEIYTSDQNSIDAIYTDLSRFVERSADAKVLTKINDISDFIQKSADNLEHISRAQGFDKQDCTTDPGLKPLSLHVQKVVDLIGKFNMFPPTRSSSRQSSSSPNRENAAKVN